MFVAAMAIAAATFTGCGNSTPKASLKSDVDTLSYAIGMAQTQGLKEYLVGTLLVYPKDKTNICCKKVNPRPYPCDMGDRGLNKSERGMIQLSGRKTVGSQSK